MWEQIISVLGGNFLGGVKDLIEAFKLPPEQAAQLQQKLAEIESQTKIAVEQAEVADRGSARNREIELSKTGQKDITPKVLAYGTTVGFFGILFSMLYHPLPSEGHDVLLVLVSVLGTAWVGIMAYYFGSSSGSTDKSATIALALGKK